MDITIKSLADFKRQVKVGSKIKCVYCDWLERSADKSREKDMYSVRTVDIVQTNAIRFAENESWFYFPKAKDIEFSNNNTFTVFMNGVKKLVYEVENF